MNNQVTRSSSLPIRKRLRYSNPQKMSIPSNSRYSKRRLNYYFLSLKITFVFYYHRRKHKAVEESDELQNALNDFCQEEEKNRKEKKKKKKQRNSTNQSAAVSAPNGVGLVGKKKRTIIARNNKKKGSISVFPGGYHISKTLILRNSIKSN